jgi:hypothetical protein
VAQVLEGWPPHVESMEAVTHASFNLGWPGLMWGRVLTFLEKCLNFDPPGKLLEKC